MQPETVAELGEIALLERIAQRLPPAHSRDVWFGDDAASFAAPSHRLLFTTDVMVENVDFKLDYCSGEDIGWKAIAINASDIAAMGGRPAQAVAALTLPGGAHVSFVDDVMTGMIAGAQRWGIDLVGGDLSGGSEIMLSIALLGAPVGAVPLMRSGASAGEAICVTGCLGGAAGGLIVLERELTGAEEARALVERQLRPVARVEEAVRLVGAGATAMIDVSDGFAVDLGHVTDSSEVGCRVDEKSIPVDPRLAWLSEHSDCEVDALTTAITGGEDLELLFTIAPERVDEARGALEELATQLVRVGTTTESGCTIGDTDLTEWSKRGWQHLLSR